MTRNEGGASSAHPHSLRQFHRFINGVEQQSFYNQFLFGREERLARNLFKQSPLEFGDTILFYLFIHAFIVIGYIPTTSEVQKKFMFCNIRKRLRSIQPLQMSELYAFFARK